MSFKEKLKDFVNKYHYTKTETDTLLNDKIGTNNLSYTDIPNVDVVEAEVTYTDNTSETLYLLVYTPPINDSA